MALHTVYTPILPNFVSSAYSYLLHWTCMFHCHSVTLLEDLLDISNSVCSNLSTPIKPTLTDFSISVMFILSFQFRPEILDSYFSPHCQPMHTFYSSASHIGCLQNIFRTNFLLSQLCPSWFNLPSSLAWNISVGSNFDLPLASFRLCSTQQPEWLSNKPKFYKAPQNLVGPSYRSDLFSSVCFVHFMHTSLFTVHWIH